MKRLKWVLAAAVLVGVFSCSETGSSLTHKACQSPCDRNAVLDTGAVTIIPDVGCTTYCVGDTVRIHWEIDTLVVMKGIAPSLILKNGMNTIPLAEQVSFEDRDFAWVVSDSIFNPNTGNKIPLFNKTFAVRAEEYDNPDHTDDSKSFCVVKCH